MGHLQLFRLFAHASLIFYIVVLVVTLISLRKRLNNTLAEYTYAALFLWLILAAKDIVYFFGDSWYNLRVTNVLMSIDLWPAPIVIALILRIVKPQWINFSRLCALIAPFFLFTIILIVTQGDAMVFLVNQIYGYALVTVFGVITMKLSYKSEKYIVENFSNTENLDIRWVRALICSLYIICVVWAIVALNTTWIGDAIYYLSTSAFVIALYYFSTNVNTVSVSKCLSEESATTPTIEESATTDKLLSSEHWCESIEPRLEQAMNEDKVFLNPQLSLTDLAVHIGTNRTYLSRYINQHKAIPFATYINNFRLKEAQRLFSNNNEHQSVAEIAELCGFSSVSTFRRVFKLHYGYAPSQISQKEE